MTRLVIIGGSIFAAALFHRMRVDELNDLDRRP